MCVCVCVRLRACVRACVCVCVWTENNKDKMVATRIRDGSKKHMTGGGVNKTKGGRLEPIPADTG